MRSRTIVRSLLAPAILAGSLTAGFSYTKPATYDKDHGSIILQSQYLYSPHGWIIAQAIERLKKDGFPEEAALAGRHLLPMLEGVTFNDVWGDADLAGSSILDYYVPDSPGEDYGFGSALFAYKNSTQSYHSHPFYDYGNSAEYAQSKYDYARRIYLGQWGAGPNDRMAGWVVDTALGQDDPQDGDWADGMFEIDAGGGVEPGQNHTNFSARRRPVDVLEDMLRNYQQSVVFDPNQTDETDSTLHLPSSDVFDHQEDWLRDHYGDGDSVEAYNGYDGHGFAWYVNWTYDAGGVGQNCSGCVLAATTNPLTDTCDAASPMLVRLPVDSKAHAFFNLGWAIHLLEDASTPVHTINSSNKTFEVHNDVEKMADQVLGPGSTVYNGQVVKDGLPTRTPSELTALYPFPPPPIEITFNNQQLTVPCGNGAIDPTDPAFYKPTWYTDTLQTNPNEGVAHAYVRETAERTTQFMSYIDCLNLDKTRSQWTWSSMGFFTAYGLDTAVKSAAGLIRQFIEDVDKTAPTVDIVQPAATGYTRLQTIKLDYSATDDESGVRSVSATLDGDTTLNGQSLASGQTISIYGQLSLGDHTFVVTAEDNAHNVGAPSVTISIIVTAASIQDDVRYFVSNGEVILNFGKPLLSKLAAATAYRSAGDCADASVAYQDFISQIQAQTGKKITADAAAFLIQDAQYLIEHCP